MPARRMGAASVRRAAHILKRQPEVKVDAGFAIAFSADALWLRRPYHRRAATVRIDDGRVPP